MTCCVRRSTSARRTSSSASLRLRLSFATLDLRDEWLGLDPSDDRPFVRGAIDLVVSFFQSGYPGLQEAQGLGGALYPLAAGDVVYGCLSALPMRR